jgi:hypothetical protein
MKGLFTILVPEKGIKIQTFLRVFFKKNIYMEKN